MAQRNATRLGPEFLTDGTFGAWVLTCDPARYDLGPEFERGSVEGWWPVGPDGGSTSLMRAGHPALLWVGGTSGEFPAGFWAVGRLLGSVAMDHEGRVDPIAAAWHDAGPHVRVELDILDPPVLAEELADDVVLGGLDVLRRPGGRVSWLTPAQLGALADFAVVPPCTVSSDGRVLALAG